MVHQALPVALATIGFTVVCRCSGISISNSDEGSSSSPTCHMETPRILKADSLLQKKFQRGVTDFSTVQSPVDAGVSSVSPHMFSSTLVPVTIAPVTLSPRPCCKAMTPECLACNMGVSVEEYCSLHPQTTGCQDRICCLAMTAECLACGLGVSVEEYCARHPNTSGCSPRPCCLAMTAQCLACGMGVSVEEYCVLHPNTLGCSPRPCCAAFKAECLACGMGVSVEEYCVLHPNTADCAPRACCRAMNAKCLACTMGLSVEEYCRVSPETAGCSGEVQVCHGILADGACWHLSNRGQNCDQSCAKHGSSYKFVAPSEDIVPKLVGDNSTTRSEPWLFLECYVAGENRYHPYNENAWGVPGKTHPAELREAGKYSYPTCRLACPCEYRSPVVVSTTTPIPEPNERKWTHVSIPGSNGGVGYATGAASSTSPETWGIDAVDRKWFMSSVAESCASTCARNGLVYSWAAPPGDNPMTPLLLDRTPARKQWPWTFLECYVPDEDRYHVVNSNAWGVPGKTSQADMRAAANWKHEICQLACPCSAASAAECGWVQPPACAPRFEYMGKMYEGCPSVDHDSPWCMHHHHHIDKEFYQYEWSNCINTCEGQVEERCSWTAALSCVSEFDYSGTHVVGCTTMDHDTPWCSTSDPYSGSWAHCSHDCDNATIEDIERMEQLRTNAEKDDLLCSWRPVQGCAATFTYEGVDYEGCAMFVDHPTPWCSHNMIHNGSWSHCEQVCTRGSSR